MSSLAITTKGQVTLKRDLLLHLGVQPGERVDAEKLPGGEVRIKAARPSGMISDLFHVLDGKLTPQKPLSVKDMNEIAAAGWSGQLDNE